MNSIIYSFWILKTRKIQHIQHNKNEYQYDYIDSFRSLYVSFMEY